MKLTLWRRKEKPTIRVACGGMDNEWILIRRRDWDAFREALIKRKVYHAIKTYAASDMFFDKGITTKEE
jgi:hypothetical protein